MVTQSRRKAGSPTGRIDRGRQQFGRINLANEILELKVRTPEESLPENISKRKDEHARRAKLGLHGVPHLSLSNPFDSEPRCFTGTQFSHRTTPAAIPQLSMSEGYR